MRGALKILAALLVLGLGIEAEFSELVIQSPNLRQTDNLKEHELSSAGPDLLSKRVIKFASQEHFSRPHFSHSAEKYNHDRAKPFRHFSKFHDFLDEIMNTTGIEFEVGEETRFVSHHMIPMRDGVKLSTIIVRPSLKEGEKRGALLSRSPYGPTSDQIANLFLVRNGYVAVIQDQRGTFLSEGVFSMWQLDGHDGYDTMEWISKQPWSNGEVYSAGISADGCGAFTQILDGPKWLKGQFLILASANAHETIYPGGAFRQGLIEGWMVAMSVFTGGKSLTHTLPEIMKHESLSDWYATVEADKYFPNVRWPTVHLTAWWDIFSGHQISAYNGLVANSHPSVRKNHTIFVGPYGHCITGNVEKPMVAYNEAKAWLNSFGFAMELFAGESDGYFHRHTKRVNFFVQGPPVHDGNRNPIGNYWTSVDSWPEIKPTKLFLAKKHSLKLDDHSFGLNLVGDEDDDDSVPGDDEYVYSPGNPTHTIGGNNFILMFLGDKCGPRDQTKNERRKDVVSFTTPNALTKPLAITGKVEAELYVSSNRPDTDFTVSLNDVYPDGYHKSIQIRYGIQRMRWRDGPTKQAPEMVNGQIYKIKVDLWPTSYIFNPGHRLRVTISSSNAPYYMRNDNLDDDIIAKRPEFGNEKAKNSIHFASSYPSHVILPVVNIEDLPRNPHL